MEMTPCSLWMSLTLLHVIVSEDTSTKCGSKPISAVLLVEWLMYPFSVIRNEVG